MIVSHLMRLRRIAGLGALLTVVVLAGVMMAGPATAHHCKGSHPTQPPCDEGDRGTNEAATFRMDVLEDLAGSITVIRAINGKESSIQNVPENGEELELNMTGFFGENADLTGRNQCFAGGTFSGALQVSADKNDPGTGWAGFWFTAKGNDGTEVKYHLSVTPVTIEPPDGAVWPYWLPDVDETATVTTLAHGFGGSWEMQHSGGPGRKVACTGDGATGQRLGDTLAFVIEITRIPTP